MPPSVTVGGGRRRQIRVFLVASQGWSRFSQSGRVVEQGGDDRQQADHDDADERTAGDQELGEIHASRIARKCCETHPIRVVKYL